MRIETIYLRVSTRQLSCAFGEVCRPRAVQECGAPQVLSPKLWLNARQYNRQLADPPWCWPPCHSDRPKESSLTKSPILLQILRRGRTRAGRYRSTPSLPKSTTLPRNQREPAHLVPLRVVPSRIAQVPEVKNQAQLRFYHSGRRLCSPKLSAVVTAARPLPDLDPPQVVFEDAHRSERRRFVGVPRVELLKGGDDDKEAYKGDVVGLSICQVFLYSVGPHLNSTSLLYK